MTYEIVKMKPLKDRPGNEKYPFAELGVGEGFYAPIDRAASLKSSATHRGKRLGRRFRVQKVDAERVQVCRVEDPK